MTTDNPAQIVAALASLRMTAHQNEETQRDLLEHIRVTLGTVSEDGPSVVTWGKICGREADPEAANLICQHLSTKEHSPNGPHLFKEAVSEAAHETLLKTAIQNTHDRVRDTLLVCGAMGTFFATLTENEYGHWKWSRLLQTDPRVIKTLTDWLENEDPRITLETIQPSNVTSSLDALADMVNTPTQAQTQIVRAFWNAALTLQNTPDSPWKGWLDGHLKLLPEARCLLTLSGDHTVQDLVSLFGLPAHTALRLTQAHNDLTSEEDTALFAGIVLHSRKRPHAQDKGLRMRVSDTVNVTKLHNLLAILPHEGLSFCRS